MLLSFTEELLVEGEVRRLILSFFQTSNGILSTMLCPIAQIMCSPLKTSVYLFLLLPKNRVIPTGYGTFISIDLDRALNIRSHTGVLTAETIDKYPLYVA